MCYVFRARFGSFRVQPLSYWSFLREALRWRSYSLIDPFRRPPLISLLLFSDMGCLNETQLFVPFGNFYCYPSKDQRPNFRSRYIILVLLPRVLTTTNPYVCRHGLNLSNNVFHTTTCKRIRKYYCRSDIRQHDARKTNFDHPRRCDVVILFRSPPLLSGSSKLHASVSLSSSQDLIIFQ